MSELKAISGNEIREDIDYNTRGIDPENKEWRNYGKELCNTLYYRKSEADKLLAELEESHKKEVEQLLIEIVELKKEIEVQKRLRNMAIASVPNALKVMKIIQHHKYKRCLAMALWCAAMSVDNQHNYKNFPTHKSKFRMEQYAKWFTRWLELAEKFKEAK